LAIILSVLFSFFIWPLYCLSFCRFPLAIILFVLLSFSFGLYTGCPFVVFLLPLYCLSFCRFPLAIILFVLCWFPFGHYIVCSFVVFLWHKIMAKGKPKKDKQYNGQRKTTKRQTI
jgi:predicted membrane protein